MSLVLFHRMEFNLSTAEALRWPDKNRKMSLTYFQQEKKKNSWDVITHVTLSNQSGSVCSINYENIDETNKNTVQKLKTNTVPLVNVVESMKNIPLSRMWKTGSGPEITFLFFFFFEDSRKIKSILSFGLGLMAKGIVTRLFLLGTSRKRIS